MLKLAFSRPTANDHEQRQLFSGFREAGFDGLQLKAGQYARYLDDPERFREEWGEDAGAVSALITAGSLDDAGTSALRQVLDFAEAVGSERVVFCHAHSRDGLTRADLERFAGTLAGLGGEARDRGVRLSLHHHYRQPVMTREDVGVFFGAAGTEAVGLTLDTAHLIWSGVHDVAGVIRDFRQVIDNVHLKDFADGRFRVLGEGAIDFGPIFAALRETGYDGWLCADEESGAEVYAGMASSYRFLRSHLGGD